MIKEKLHNLENEVRQLKKEMVLIKRFFLKEPIIIECLTENDLTKKEKRLLKEAEEDLKKGRKEKFITLEELKNELKDK